MSWWSTESFKRTKVWTSNFWGWRLRRFKRAAKKKCRLNSLENSLMRAFHHSSCLLKSLTSRWAFFCTIWRSRWQKPASKELRVRIKNLDMSFMRFVQWMHSLVTRCYFFISFTRTTKVLRLLKRHQISTWIRTSNPMITESSKKYAVMQSLSY